MQEKQKVGEVTHYFNKAKVVVIKLSDTLRVGDTISVEGATTDFTQEVESMEVEHDSIQEASGNQEVGLKVKKRAREGDIVYKLAE